MRRARKHLAFLVALLAGAVPLAGQDDECFADEDCSAPTPVCDTSGKVNICIAECDSHDDCDDAVEPTCVDGACLPCTELIGDAAQDAACQADDPSLPVCENATGSCQACESHGDCINPTPICDSDIEPNNCVACDEAHACPGGNVCSGGTCVECAESGDCDSEAEPVCVENVCAPCTVDPAATGDAQCQADDPPLNACSQGQCVACTADAHCPDLNPDDDEACFTSTNTCVECTANAHCEDGNTGGDVCDVATMRCGECSLDNEPPDGCGETTTPICVQEEGFHCEPCDLETNFCPPHQRCVTEGQDQGACTCLLCDDFELGDQCLWSAQSPPDPVCAP